MFIAPVFLALIAPSRSAFPVCLCTRELLWWINIHACTVLLFLFYFYVAWDEMKAATSLWERQALAYWAARSSGAYDICYSKIDYTAHIEYGIENIGAKEGSQQQQADGLLLSVPCWATSGRRSEVNGVSCRDNMQRSSSFGKKETEHEERTERRDEGTTGFSFFFFFLFDGRPFLCLLLYAIAYSLCWSFSRLPIL
jgi:hypothetical protein